MAISISPSGPIECLRSLASKILPLPWRRDHRAMVAGVSLRSFAVHLACRNARDTLLRRTSKGTFKTKSAQPERAAKWSTKNIQVPQRRPSTRYSAHKYNPRIKVRDQENGMTKKFETSESVVRVYADRTLARLGYILESH